MEVLASQYLQIVSMYEADMQKRFEQHKATLIKFMAKVFLPDNPCGISVNVTKIDIPQPEHYPISRDQMNIISAELSTMFAPFAIRVDLETEYKFSYASNKLYAFVTVNKAGLISPITNEIHNLYYNIIKQYRSLEKNIVDVISTSESTLVSNLVESFNVTNYPTCTERQQSFFEITSTVTTESNSAFITNSFNALSTEAHKVFHDNIKLPPEISRLKLCPEFKFSVGKSGLFTASYSLQMVFSCKYTFLTIIRDDRKKIVASGSGVVVTELESGSGSVVIA